MHRSTPNDRLPGWTGTDIVPAVPEALRRTPLFERQRALGGRFVPFAGWEMPVQFEGVTAEHRAVRTAVGLFDVSHMGELWVEGPGAPAGLDALVTNDVGALPVGRALYTVACNEAGGILDDLIIYRLGRERLLVVCNASNRDKMRAHLAERLDPSAGFADRSDEFCLLALQGPRAQATLEAAGAPPDVTGLSPFGVAETALAGVELIVARTGYTGEDGFELFCNVTAGPSLWDTLMTAGAAEGISPIGLGARDTLRLEAKLSLYGNDIDEGTNPYEAGLGWTVKLDKGDFLGREVLVAVKRDKPSRRLVGFEMRGRGIARPGYPVLDESGEQVGSVRSGGPGLTVDKRIGLAYLPRELARVGTPLGIEIRGKVIEAAVVKTPFYKRAS